MWSWRPSWEPFCKDFRKLLLQLTLNFARRTLNSKDGVVNRQLWQSATGVLPVLVLLFVALWFILRGDLFYVLPCVILFFSPFSIAITSLGEEGANLSAFRTFVRFALVWFCLFALPLGVWEGLRFVIVALPGLFSYLFLDLCVSVISKHVDIVFSISKDLWS